MFKLVQFRASEEQAKRRGSWPVKPGKILFGLKYLDGAGYYSQVYVNRDMAEHVAKKILTLPEFVKEWNTVTLIHEGRVSNNKPRVRVPDGQTV